MKNRIRELREANGISQQQLEKRSGVSRRVLSGLETGERKDCRLSTMEMIAEAFDCPVACVFPEVLIRPWRSVEAFLSDGAAKRGMSLDAFLADLDKRMPPEYMTQLRALMEKEKPGQEKSDPDC